ncbi:hypothetical protein CC80DRAFT_538329 [Byssothecium circinans]|uniref:Uncharacterized protein n=1 Tax=Byssothecium circinans TaxID=147558 RepID=A0A6A5TL10_9PLEO|nr:hypothetical protein CC80DRAFT_538329 [Byssothecium circinans]
MAPPPLNVTPTTIRNCWAKSTILERADDPGEPEPPHDLSELLREAQAVAGISEDARDLQSFMAPEDEDEEPEQQVDLQIMDYYTGKQDVEVIEEEDDEPEPPLSLSQAICALSTLQRYVEEQEDSTIDDVKALNAIERRLHLKGIKSRKQTTINDYFSRSAALKDG